MKKEHRKGSSTRFPRLGEFAVMIVEAATNTGSGCWVVILPQRMVCMRRPFRGLHLKPFYRRNALVEFGTLAGAGIVAVLTR